MLQIASPTTPRTTSAQIHPTALFSILECFTRRPEGQTRVVGTLLGNLVDSVASTEKSVLITNAFAIPFKEANGTVAMGKDFQSQMLHLHQRCNKTERVVGWFSTSSTGEMIVESSALIQDYYNTQCPYADAIHVVVDTSLKSDSLSLAAYICTPLSVGNKALANMFEEVRRTAGAKDDWSEAAAAHYPPLYI